MSAEDIVAVFEVMTELECMAAKLAASRMSQDMRETLLAVYWGSQLFTDAESRYDALDEATRAHLSWSLQRVPRVEYQGRTRSSSSISLLCFPKARTDESILPRS